MQQKFIEGKKMNTIIIYQQWKTGILMINRTTDDNVLLTNFHVFAMVGFH